VWCRLRSDAPFLAEEGRIGNGFRVALRLPGMTEGGIPESTKAMPNATKGLPEPTEAIPCPIKVTLDETKVVPNPTKIAPDSIDVMPGTDPASRPR